MQSIAHVAGVPINSVAKLPADTGKAYKAFHDAAVRGVRAQRVLCDEIWSFVHCKAKNLETAKAAPQGAGDCWKVGRDRRRFEADDRREIRRTTP